MEAVGPGSPHPFFTVFTATYQRAATLHRVYESLAAQTFRDFEWLVVDDGSTDGTEALVARWVAEGPFPIRYHRQPNQGKHVAWNLGVELAAGFAFLSLDSDDACLPEALQVFHEAWSAIPEAERGAFTGVCALVRDERGALSGSRFPSDVLDSDSIETRLRYRVTGEKWGFHRTEVLRAHPFPVVPGSTFVPESVVWFRIALAYRQRFINRVLRIWYQPETDGSRLTLSPVWKNAAGRAVLHRMVIDELGRWVRYRPGYFLAAAASYVRTSLHAGVGVGGQWSALTSARGRLLWLAGLPVGWGYYLRDAPRKRADQRRYAGSSTT